MTFKQQTTSDAPPRAASSGRPIPTKALLRIGQEWQKRGRRRIKTLVRIRQIHRAERHAEVDVLVLAPQDERPKGGLVTFTDLRKRYDCVKDPTNPNGGHIRDK